ncbi:hypothetical protein EYF80_024180 [Liparis tanakae]|uniref:Uncharacterized protein n=1 Tax=Liparis tanakae TaxID=230148 RepID=A0A4Z2HJ79_9TELE|nr:hypothetical protein EYF80_024180 [Liparis tanakae]
MSQMSCGHTWKKATTRSARHRWKTKTRILDICLRCLQRTSSRELLRMAALMKMTLRSAISSLARLSSLAATSAKLLAFRGHIVVSERVQTRQQRNRLPMENLWKSFSSRLMNSKGK